jgi:hypothetical protein
VRRGVVRQDKHRRLARTREVARHAVHEVGPDAVKVVQVRLYRFRRHFGPAGAELPRPAIPAGIVHHIRVFRPVPDRLAQHARDDARRGPLHQLETKRAFSFLSRATISLRFLTYALGGRTAITSTSSR